MFESYRMFIERYVHIDPIEWQLIRSKAKIIRFAKGEVIHHIGDVCDTLLFVNSGLARGYIIDEEGKDSTWSIYFNDEKAHMSNLFAVDYGSFISRTPSKLAIDALEDCEMVAMAYEDVQFVYEKSRKGERFGRMMAQEAYRYLHDFFIDRQILSAKERFEKLLLETPYLLEKVPQYHIATFLGVTPQYLSMLKRTYDIAPSSTG